MIVEQIYTGCLSQGAYYIESRGEVAIIDPLREVNEYIEKANANNSKIKYVKNKSRGFNSALITGIKSSDADALLIYMADDHNNFNLINKILNFHT